MSIFLLIPLAPLLAFLILAFSGRSLGESSHRVAAPAIGLSFLLSLGAFASVADGGSISISLYRLLESGNLIIDLSLYIDQLTVLVLLLVTGVSFVVHVYSSRYMIGDPRYKRFFAVMALFTFAMIMLVMSNNLLMTYMFWEVMGICSYLLISHWAERTSACKAATKAFLVNSVADVGLGFGVILTFAIYGTLDIQQIVARAAEFSGQTMAPLSWIGIDLAVGVNTLITLFIFTGALGKSAQVPLHVWLPFAMEAPTPVSALIHAATMVNAGPFLLVRLSPLVVLAPAAMVVIAVVGATTALFGALVSLTQSDIKKLLAYSTISQIGFMIFLCGVGAFVAAIFHLLAHGFLKGFLFLSTGNALKATGSHGHAHPEAAQQPLGRSLVLGALLLACVPPLILFSGAYENVWTAHQLPSAQWAFWIIGLATVFLTAMYVFRGIVSLFQQTLIVGDAGAPDSIRVQPRLFSSRASARSCSGGSGRSQSSDRALVVVRAVPCSRASYAAASARASWAIRWGLLVACAAPVSGGGWLGLRLLLTPKPSLCCCWPGGVAEDGVRVLSKQTIFRRNLRVLCCATDSPICGVVVACCRRAGDRSRNSWRRVFLAARVAMVV